MEIISKLPEGAFVIGAREIAKAAASGKVKNIVAAANCPDFLVARMPLGSKIVRFEGDQKDLGTKLGKPFPVAMVGYQ